MTGLANGFENRPMPREVLDERERLPVTQLIASSRISQRSDRSSETPRYREVRAQHS